MLKILLNEREVKESNLSDKITLKPHAFEWLAKPLGLEDVISKPKYKEGVYKL